MSRCRNHFFTTLAVLLMSGTIVQGTTVFAKRGLAIDHLYGIGSLGLAPRYRANSNEMWNYDPFWYDLLSRPEVRKRSLHTGEGASESEDETEVGKRLFVARIGKRNLHVYSARVGR